MGQSEVNNGFLFDGASVGYWGVVKLSEKEHLGLGGAMRGSTVLIKGMHKGEFVSRLTSTSNCHESDQLFVGSIISEVGEDKFVVGGCLLEAVAVHKGGGGSYPLEDPAHDLVLGSASSILLLLTILKEVESWESSDAVLFGLLLVLGGVQLGDVVWGVVLSEPLGGLGVLWGQSFAMTTPRCVELYEEEFLLVDEFIEVGVGEDIDVVVQLRLFTQSTP
mmetsp:Transcript_7370/g.6614  ORF Transcript_7370/g.6614 Transcript_7370/m.6614 type:complete len:220 (+) Transcript_7370:806-1465(+)